MTALTPTVLMDLESRMQVITEDGYNRLNANLWWPKITKLRTTGARRDVLLWLLSTAQIRDQGPRGGNIHFEDIVSQFTEIENRFSGAGLELEKAQLEDTDGNGVDLASQWSRDIGAYMAYWPQKQVTDVLKNGHDIAQYKGYDLKAFFATDHPINPYKTSAGTFANVFTGASSGSYPGAVPVIGVTAEVALLNLSKIFGYIAGIKQPNGEDPRRLRPLAIFAPPLLFPTLVQLTAAKFIATNAGGGVGGSADISALMQALGYAQPIMVDELAGYEDDKTFYIAAASIGESELGAIVYTEREAYKINYFGVVDDAKLSRMRRLEWHCHGRNGVSPGHPYLLFKCRAV